MRWTQEQLDSQSIERREVLAWLLHAERIAAMPMRVGAFKAQEVGDQIRLELVLYPPDESE